MTRTAKLLATFLAITLLLTASLLVGQSRGQRGTNAQRGSRGTSEEVTTPPRGTANAGPAGNIVPPGGGYVGVPESASPGSVTGPVITDPLERAYWEFYDRKQSVTLTGKVTRVNWTHPNTYIFLVARGAEWAVESSYIHFRPSGLNPAVKADQTITVTGYFPKEELPETASVRPASSVSSYLKENHLIRAAEITTASGQKLDMGRPMTEKEESDRRTCRSLGGC